MFLKLNGHHSNSAGEYTASLSMDIPDAGAIYSEIDIVFPYTGNEAWIPKYNP